RHTLVLTGCDCRRPHLNPRMPVKTTSSSRRRLPLAVLLATPLTAFSQTATPSASTTPAKSETVILSPFEVTTEQDEGFVASSALAGGRLNLELKDVPAAYSVITRD